MAAANNTIIAMGSNSASPTDTFIIMYKKRRPFYPFKNNSATENIYNMYDTVVHTDSVFYKVFIDDTSLPIDYDRDLRTGFQAGIYEFQIYRDVIKPLLDFKISPHFIRYYTIIQGASFDQYKERFDYLNLTPPISEDQILRNINYMYKFKARRPALTTSVSPMEDFLTERTKSIYRSLKFNILGLMPINKTTTMTLSDYLQTNYPASTPITPDGINNLYIIYFQILQAVYSLFKSGTVHNDLHSGNVWITTRPKKTDIRYHINGQTYNIRTNICVRIYDFDRAYSVRLGDNPGLGDNERASSQTNELIPMKDFLKVYCYVDGYFKRSLITNKSDVLFSELDKFYKDTRCFLRDGIGIAFTSGSYVIKLKDIITRTEYLSDISKIPSFSAMNENDLFYMTYFQYIYNKITSKFTSAPHSTFTCNNDMFANGIVTDNTFNDCCEDDPKASAKPYNWYNYCIIS